MKVKRTILAEIIVNLSHKMPSKKLAREVASYMLSEGRINELDALLRDIARLRAERGLVESDVESAFELNANLANQVKQVIKKLHPSAKSIIINESINPELIGGVKISLPDEQLDTSLRGKLNRMRQYISEGAS